MMAISGGLSMGVVGCSSRKMKWYVDRKWQDVEFKVGDKVFLKMSKGKFKLPDGMSYSLT